MDLPAATIPLAALSEGPPLLQVVIDTEEEFDWAKPFQRSSVSVRSMAAQWQAQEIFRDFGVIPTYLIDYPVATTPEAVGVLQEFMAAGRCLIGTHLHPWVNPPFAEAVLASTSYACNLRPELEREKLRILHEAISAAFSTHPAVYRAGRYGLGVGTIGILESLGYLVDVSVLPHADLRGDGGPDFRAMPDRPFWLNGTGGILEIPMTRGFSGIRTGQAGAVLHERLQQSRGGGLALSAFSRLGLLERATLTPESAGTASHRRLLRALLRDGHRIFTMSYHSPSLAAGHTPYVRNPEQLKAFLRTIRETLEFFFGTLGGQPTTPLAVRALALAGPAGAADAG